MYGNGVITMTEKEFNKLFKQIDKGKYEVFYNEGIAFDFCFTDKKGEWSHTRIGNGVMATRLLLGVIYDLYSDIKHKITAEEFAESIKKNFLELVELKEKQPPVTVDTESPETVNSEKE